MGVLHGIVLSAFAVTLVAGVAPEKPKNAVLSGNLDSSDCEKTHSYICEMRKAYMKKKKPPQPEPLDCGSVEGYQADSRTGHCYKFHTQGQTWPRAYLTCAAEGGHLAIINSDVEATVLKELFAKYPRNTITAFYADAAQIGILDFYKNGTWTTINGQQLQEAGYAGWSPGEPNNLDGSQYCGSVTRNGRLDDTFCYKPHPYICEKEPKNPHQPNKPDTTLRAGYVQDSRTGHYYKFHTQGQSWPRAYLTCAAEGAHLAVINSDVEATVLKELFAKYPSEAIIAQQPGAAHIGFLDFYSNRTWFTIEGQGLAEAGYAKWAPGEPNNGQNNQYCGGMYRSGLLDDTYCNITFPFICEKDRA